MEKFCEREKKEHERLERELKESKEKRKKEEEKSRDEKKKLLKKQTETSRRMEELLQTEDWMKKIIAASEALRCGPVCQREKELTKLNQEYLNAQTNVQVAPITLEETKKNYYVFKDGRPFYENMLEKELEEKAEHIATIISENFDEEVGTVTTLNEVLNTDTINSVNTFELYDDYAAKNLALEALIAGSKGDILTNDRKTYYETQEYDNLLKWRTRFLWVYYALVIVFILGIFLLPTQMNIISLIIMVILLLVYPFIIDGIVQTIWRAITQMLGYLPKNVYNNL